MVCLAFPVLMMGGLVVGMALMALFQKLSQVEERVVSMSDALRIERDARVALADDLARARAEIANVALRGEALRPASMGARMPSGAAEEDVEAAVRAAVEPREEQAVAGVRAVARGVAKPAVPGTPPVVKVVKAGVDDLEEHDIRNALGDTVRPPGAPAKPKSAGPEPTPAPNVPPVDPASPKPPPPKAPFPADREPPAPLKLPGIETLAVWLAATLAGLVLVVAVLFGLREAIAAGLFGPSLRFAAAIFVALGTWAFSGFLRWRKFDIPANALAGGATAIAYAAIYAGHARYGLVPQSVASASMVVITAVAMFSATRHDAGLWALIAALGGFATPLLLSTGENKAVAFFTYLFLLNFGILVASRRRGWFWLVAIAGTITAALHLGWGFQYRAPDQVLTAFVASFVLGTAFLVTAREGASGLVRGAAFYGAIVLLLAGMPFLVPADPFLYDARSGLPLAWSLGSSAEQGAGWLLAVTVLLSVFSGSAREVAASGLRLVVTLVLGAGALTFGLGWGFAAEPRWDAVVVAVGALLLLSSAAGRLRGPELLAGPILAASTLLGILYGVGDVAPGWGLGLSLCLTVAALALALLVDAAAPLAAAFAILPLVVNLSARLTPFLPEGGYALMAAVVAFQAFAVVMPFRLGPSQIGAATTVLLVGPLSFWGFHRLWEQGIGAGEGILALVLGVYVALAARMARARGVSAESGQFAALLIGVLGFAALAIPLQLDRGWLTVGWAVEVAALAGLSRRYHHVGIKLFMGLLAVVVSARLLLNPWALNYGNGEGWILLNWTLYTWGVPGTALLVASALLKSPEAGKRALWIAATFIFFALVNLEVAHAFARDGELSFRSEHLLESMTRSISWGVFGIVVMGIGLVWQSKVARLFGFGFALLAAAKVGIVDVVALPGWIRIGSLAGLAGVLLVASLVFVYVLRKAESNPSTESP